MKRIVAFNVVLLLFSLLSWAQVPDAQKQLIEDLVEEVAQQSDGEQDYSQLTDVLYYYLTYPVNLNQTNAETLEQLRILNDFQIKSLLDYISINGDLVTLYELQLIEGYDYTTIRKMLPFVTLSANTSAANWEPRKALKYGDHIFLGRMSSVIETPEGFKDVSDSVLNANANKYYEGNRSKIYGRYAFNYKNKLRWGVTMDKDPGEQFFAGTQPYGFDFYSAFLQISDVGIVKNFILGDFQAQFGQGLVMWSSLSQGKSSYTMDIRKRGNGLKKYSSTDENLFFRGAGITLQKWNTQFTLFGSFKRLDANIERADSLNATPFFTSLPNTGIHALPSEIEDENAVKESVLGGNLNWQHKSLRIGVSSIAYQYDLPLKPEVSAENRFRFNGTSNYNIGTDIEYRIKALHLFGEVASSANGGKAIIVGSLMELSPKIRTSVLYRNYQRHYQALYSNGFAEGSQTQNETGVYMGIEMLPFKKWKIAAYYDFFTFPWLKTSVSSPSKGNEYLIQADFLVSRNFNMYFRFKHEQKEENTTTQVTEIANLTELNKNHLRYHLNYQLTNHWNFKNRLELSWFTSGNQPSEKGFLFYQDLNFETKNKNLSVTARYSIFDTYSYDSRIYAYESDVLYAFTIPAFYGKGLRTYILVNYKVNAKLEFWLRLSQTQYADLESIGSGLNQITGPTKSEFRIQLRYKI